MATPRQKRARDLNFAIFRVKGARQLFQNLGKQWSLEVQDAVNICDVVLRKLRRVR